MYMLLLVESQEKEFVEGTHLQWCCACELEQVIARARRTEQANSNRITVAVIDELYDSYAMGRHYRSKRLD